MCKISVLTSSDYPFGGAPENFVREMIEGISNSVSNCEIEVVLFWGQRNCFNNDTNVECCNFLFRKPVKNELLKFVELFFQILNIPFFVIKTKILKKKEVLLLYGIDRFYIVSPILLFSKLFKLKCIRIVTEIYLKEDYSYHWWRKPLIFFNNIQIKYFDKYLDGVVVLSNYLKNICIKNGVAENNVLVIPHFINFNRNLPKTLQFDSNATYRIVYSGTITIDNGISDLIDAYIHFYNMSVTNCSLTIMGKKNPTIYNKQDEIELEKFNIKFTGNLKRDDIFTTMHNASLLVNPRRKSILADSGFPTKLGEYFSTKIPVLSTSVGDLNLYFKHGEELYFSPPNDPLRLSQMMYYIYNQKDESFKVGENGFNWGIEYLDNKTNAIKIVDFIYKGKLY